jgi:hypothetical protein
MDAYDFLFQEELLSYSPGEYSGLLAWVALRLVVTRNGSRRRDTRADKDYSQ